MSAEREIKQLFDAVNRVVVDVECTQRAVERARCTLCDTSLYAADPAQTAVRGPRVSTRRLAATIGIATSVLLLLVFLIPRRADSLAAMLRELEATETATFLLHTREAGGTGTDSRVFCAANGDFRIEESNERYVVHDFGEVKSLLVDTSSRQAIIVYGAPKRQRINMYEELRKLHRRQEIVELGREELDGAPAVKLQAKINTADSKAVVTLWLNPAKMLPRRIEFASVVDSVPLIQLMSDIEFDADLPPDTFSTEVPAGFSLTDRLPQPDEVTERKP